MAAAKIANLIVGGGDENVYDEVDNPILDPTSDDEFEDSYEPSLIDTNAYDQPNNTTRVLTDDDHDRASNQNRAHNDPRARPERNIPLEPQQDKEHQATSLSQDELNKKLLLLTDVVTKIEFQNNLLLGIGERDEGLFSYIKPVKIPEHEQQSISTIGARAVESMFKYTTFSNQKGENVVDFLLKINRIQKDHKIKESELIRLIGTRVGKEVAPIYNALERQECSLGQIFTTLYRHFNKDLEPSHALRVMATYKIPINYDMMDFMSDVRQLADMASMGCLDEKIKEMSKNERGMTLYMHQTPPFISSIVTKFVDYHHKSHGIFPDLKAMESRFQTELTRLNQELESLKKHPTGQYTFGKARSIFDYSSFQTTREEKDKREGEAKGKGKGKRSDKKVFALTTSSVNVSQASSSNHKVFQSPSSRHADTSDHKNEYISIAKEGINEKYGHKFATKHINALTSSMENNVQRKRFIPKTADGKKYCSLCSASSHNAVMGCFSMFNNNYEKLNNVVPTMGWCAICSEKLSLKLHHNKSLCPLRPEAIQGYKSKKVRPIGVFKTYFEKHHQKQ